jgi:DNA-binding MarR family transcriptional regulator
MTYVKADFPADQTHVPMLMGLLYRHIHLVFDAEDWGGLRQSHFRGQFVTRLVESGHLAVDADPGDRRVRRVRRTAKGRRTLDAVRERNLLIEGEWAEQVGVERYRVFRDVLEELALGSLPG